MDIHTMTGWKITGILATSVLILMPPLYLWRERHIDSSPDATATKPVESFVGSERCGECHRPEYDRWKRSHHDLAMDAASEQTVRGDFRDATFEHFGTVSRFFRRNGGFFVHTAGPNGEVGDFEITHTLGWYPLQQYLIPFPGGRLQCLPIAWDVRRNRWYHLYPDQAIDPTDWLYWTNAGQNWNGMCAECHTTQLQKNYDPEADTYQTTWSALDVGCEACHGPGSSHTAWAELPAMARPALANHGLVVGTSNLDSRRQNELCAPCHSRRMSLSDNTHQHAEFMDYAVPQLLQEGMYFPDGQILEEVYVFGSFMQSKMYARDVRCSDCHDVHSVKRLRDGNELCRQCHRGDIYDSKQHHFHKQKGETGDPIRSKDGRILFEVGSGAACENCHMPGRYYMGVDYRLDHSFRVPRPDLSRSLGVPNACNQCHQGESIQWSIDQVTRWYGEEYKPHYGTTLQAGRRRLARARDDLIRLTGDRLVPAIARATALSLLANYRGEEVSTAFELALIDDEPLMRQTALRSLETLAPETRARLLSPLLDDPIKAVRIEAASGLAGAPSELLDSDRRERLRTVLEEYEQAMRYTADFAPSRHNLGNLYAELGQLTTALNHYREAIRIDSEFYPAKVNLAMLHNRMGDNQAAENLLRQVVDEHPDLYEIHYSLGLLLVEMGRHEDAVASLQAAADGLPNRHRIQYNLGLLMARLQRWEQAESSLLKAYEMAPDDRDYLYALVDFYLKRQRLPDAKFYAQQLASKHPSFAVGREMLNFIESRLQP